MKSPTLLFTAIALFFCSITINAAPMLSLNAKASALGNAVTAEAVGADSPSFNPATLTQLHMGPKGIYRDYKYVALPFPNYSVTSEKPAPEDDRFDDVNLVVNDCTGSCLLGETDPRDAPWNPELEKFAFYVPGYGEVDIDVDLLKFIVAPLIGQVKKPSPESKFVYSLSFYLPAVGGAHLKAQDWNYKPTTYSMGGMGISPSFAYKLSSTWSIGGRVHMSASGIKIGSDYRWPGISLGAINELWKESCELIQVLNTNMCNLEGDGPLDPNKPLFHFALEGKDNFNFGFKVGVLWEAATWFSWGFAYTHGGETNFKGDGALTLSSGARDYLLGLGSDIPLIETLFLGDEEIAETFNFNGTLNIPIPKKIDTGISVWFTERLKVNVDYHWRESSAFNDSSFDLVTVNEPGGNLVIPAAFSLFTGVVDLTMPTSIVISEATPLRLTFKNSGSFAYGLSYKYNQHITFRGGFSKSPTPIGGDLPLGILGDINKYSIGLSYQRDHNSLIDVTYLRLEMDERVEPGESLLTEVQINPMAVFAGTSLSSLVEANIFLFNWSKRI